MKKLPVRHVKLQRHPDQIKKLLSIETGGAVSHRDLVTSLRLVPMQNITKLAMLQSQKPRSPLPQNY
jgi:hypothetical protein